MKIPHRKRLALCKYMFTNIRIKVLEYGEDASKVRVYISGSHSADLALGGEHLCTKIQFEGEGWEGGNRASQSPQSVSACF